MKKSMLFSSIIAITGLLCAVSARAQTITKADNSDNLDQTTSWQEGAVPNSGTIALWDGTYTTGNTATLGSNLSWLGLRILSPSAAVTINGGGSSLTLGNVGIDMSAATQNLTLNANLFLAAAQSWTVNSSRLLTLNNALDLGNTVLTITGAGDTTMGGIISSSGSLTKSGTGTLLLSGNNNYTGGTYVNGGILRAATSGNAVPGDIGVGSGATFDVNALNMNVGSRTVTIAGAGAAGQLGVLVNTGSGEAWIRNLTLSANATIGTSAGKLNIGNTVNGGGFTLTATGTGEKNIRTDNALTNLGGIVVNQGTLRLESSQNWTGTITVNAGARLDSYGTRTESPHVSLVAGTLGNGGGGVGTWNGNISFTDNSILNANGGNMTLNGSLSGSGLLTRSGNYVALYGPLALTGDATISTGARLDLFGTVNSGSYVLYKTGGDVLDFRGGVTSLGGLVINQGRVRMEENNGFGSWAGPVTINSSGILSPWGSRTIAANITLAGGRLEVESNGAATWNGNLTFQTATTSTVDAGGSGSHLLNGTISGPGGLTKTGTGTLTIANTGSVGGTFYVQGGTVNIPGTFNSVGKTIINGNSTLNFSGTGAWEIGQNDWAGVGDGSNGALYVTAGSLTITPSTGSGFFIGNASVGVVEVSGGVLTLNNTSALRIGGIAAVNNSFGTLTISSSGRVVATGTSAQQIMVGASGGTSVVGVLNLNGGTLETARSIVRTTTAVGTLNFNGGALKATGDNANWIQSLSAVNILGNGAVINSDTYTVAIAQDLLDGGSGTGGLTKLGAGTLTLSGANSYSGGTTVSGGMLQIGTGSGNQGATILPSGTVTVASGAAIDFAMSSEANRNLSGRNFYLAGSGPTGQGALTVTQWAASPTYVNIQLANGTLTADATIGIYGQTGNNTSGIHMGEAGGTFNLNGHNLTLTGDGGSLGKCVSMWNSGYITDTVGGGGITIDSGGMLAFNGLTPTWTGTITVNGGTLAARGGSTFNGPVVANTGITSSILGASADLTLNGNVSGSGTVNNASGSYSVWLGGSNSGFSGTWNQISGSTRISATTGGSANATWNVTGGNIFSHPAGTPVIELGALSGTGGILQNATAGSTATFQVGALGIDTAFSGTINNGSGVTALTKVGGGMLTLSGGNNYTGVTAINGGTLAVTTTFAGNGANSAIGAGSTLTFDGGALRYTGGNTAGFNRFITLNGGGGTIDQSNGGYLFLAGTIDGSGNLTKVGANQLIISGNNSSYDGITYINQGEIQLRNSNALGSTVGKTVVASGAQLAAGGGTTMTFPEDIDLNGNGVSGNGALQSNDGGTAATYAGTITLVTDSSVGGGTSFTISGPIAGSGALTKVGGNILTLSGSANNTYGGLTTLSGNGQLGLAKTGGAIAIPGDITLAATSSRGILYATQDNQFAPGAVLRWSGTQDNRFELNGTAQTLAGIDNVGATGYNNIQVHEFAAVAAVSSTSTLTLNGSGNYSFTGTIRDNGGQLALIKTGTGTQALASGTPDGILYTGPTAINGGVLSVNALASNGAKSGIGAGSTLTFDGGTLRLTGGGAQTFNRYITLNAGGGTIDNSSSSYAYHNGGVISGPGSLTKIGTGQYIEGGNNTYDGITYINQGELQLRNNNALGSTAGKTVVASGAQLAAGGGTTMNFPENIDLNGYGITGNGALQSNDAGTAATYSGIITLVTDSGVGSGTGTGFTIGGTITGAGALHKVSGNTVTLSGNNNYTGGTTISAGTLALTGSIASSPTITVANGAIFDVSGVGGGFSLASGQSLHGLGTVVGNLSIGAGSQLSPGNSPGTINDIGTVTYAGGGTYVWEINSASTTFGTGKGVDPGYDWQNITGLLDVTASSGSKYTIDITGLSGASPGTVANWDPHSSYSWVLATASLGINNFASGSFNLNTANFFNNNAQNNLGAAAFTISTSGNDLLLNFQGAGSTAYWDLNGATAGAGGATPAGTWSATSAANWSLNSAGTMTTANWTNGDDAIFAAGADATGAYAVTIDGAGVTANTVTVEEGSPTISGGVLTLSGGTITVASQATISANVNGGAGLTKTGTGTLVLGGNNGYTGGTSVNAGILRITNANSLPDAGTVNAGATFDVNGQNLNSGSKPFTIAGSGAAGQVGALVNTSTADGLVNNITLAGNATVGATDAGFNGRMDIFGSTINLNGFTLTTAGVGMTDIRGLNALQGAGGVVVSQGILRMEASQNWTGTFTVNSGAIIDTWTPATIAGNLTLNGGTLQNVSGSYANWTGTITLTDNSFVNSSSRIDFANGGTVIGTTYTLTKNGGDVLDFRGGVTSLGGLVINQGRVRLEENNGFGTWTGPVTINPTGILSPWGTRTIAANIFLAGGTLGVENNGAATWNGNLTFNSTSTVDAGGSGSHLLNGTIAGPGGMNKTGTGTLTIANTGSVGGQFYVLGGTVNIPGTFNSVGKTIINGNATLNFSGTGAWEIAQNDWVGVGDNSNGALYVTAGSLTLTPANGFFIGNNSIGQVEVSGGVLTLNNNNPLRLGGIGGVANSYGTLTISGSGRVVATGTGSQQIMVGASTGSNVQGVLNLNGGTLETARTLVRTTTATGSINFAGGALKAAGNNYNWIRDVPTYVKSGGAVIDDGGFNTRIGQPLLDAGGGGLTKTGTGSLNLTANNTYTGGTTVNDGKLISGNPGALGPGAVTLNGGTLVLATTPTSVSGFGGTGTGWTLNGGATAAGDILTVTTAGTGEARSAFYNQPLSTSDFTLNFTYSATAQGPGGSPADGLAFVFQNDPRGPTAVGVSGGALGYGGTTAITPSAAWGINLYPPNTQGIANQIWLNGTLAGGYGAATGINIYGTPFDVSLDYVQSAGTLTVTLTQGATTYSKTYSGLNLPTLLGSTTYFGISGGTGGAYAQQEVSNFSYTAPGSPSSTYANSVIVPAGMTGSLGVLATTQTPNFSMGALTLGADSTLNVVPDSDVIANLSYGLSLGATTLSGANTISVSNHGTGQGELTLAAVSGTGSLTKAGNGGLTLTTTDTYSGITTVANAGGFNNESRLWLDSPTGDAVPGDLHVGVSTATGGNVASVNLNRSEQIADSGVLYFDSTNSGGNNWANFRLLGHNETIAGISSSTGLGQIENIGYGFTGINNDGTLTINTPGAASYSFTGVMRNQDGGGGSSGTGIFNLVKTGTGTQTLAGGNIVYSGPTTVTGGRLTFSNTTGLGTPLINNSATVNFYANGTAWFVPSILSGSGLYQVDGPGGGSQYDNRVVLRGNGSNNTGTIDVINNGKLWLDRGVNAIGDSSIVNVGSHGGFYLYSNAGSDGWGTFQVAETIGGLSGSGNVYGHWVGGGVAPVLTVGGGNVSASFSGPISDYPGAIAGLALTKIGTGTQVLSGVSTYGGPTTIIDGTLKIGDVVTLSGFGLNGTGWQLNNNATANPPTIVDDLLTLTTSGTTGQARTAFYLTPLTLNGSFTASFTYTPSGGGTRADGTAFILQNSTGGAAALGGGGGGLGFLGITPSAGVELNIYSGAPGGIGTKLGINGSTGGYTSVAPVSLNGGNPINVTLNYDPVAQTITQVLVEQNTSNVSTLTYSGVDLSTILGGNTGYFGFSGATGGATATQTISNFALSMPGLGALPSTTPVSIGSTATLDLNGANQTIASLVDYGGGGGLVTNGAPAKPITLTLGATSGSTSFSGDIKDDGSVNAISLAKTGGSTQILAGNNTYSGDTTVTGGTLTIGSTTAVPNGSGKGDVRVNGNIDLNGFSPAINGLWGAGTVTSGTGGTPVLTVGADNDTSVFGGQVLDGSATVALTKTGTGTLTMTGPNAYSGPTVITQGQLSLQDANLTGPVSMSAGTTLALYTGGLLGEYFNIAPANPNTNFNTLSALNAHLSSATPALTANSILAGANFNFQANGSAFPAPYNNQPQSNFEVRWVGAFNAPSTGTYTFGTQSDDGSVIWIDGNDAPVVNNNFFQGYGGSRRNGTVYLTEGMHEIVVGFYEGGGDQGLTAYLQPPGGVDAPLSHSLLSSLGGNHFIGSLSGAPGSTIKLGNGTINVNQTADNTFAGVITGTGGSLVKGGGAKLTLTDHNTYTGATIITAGTLTLGGATASSLVGFGGNGTGWQVNSINIGGTPISGDALTLTDNGGSEARSAYYMTKLTLNTSFIASFTYVPSGNRAADGAVFMLQNSGTLALGGTGGALGYNPISPSMAIELNIYGGASGGIGTRYAVNGAVAGYTSVSPVNLASGNPIEVTLTYDPATQVLTETLVEQNTANTRTFTYTGVDLATILGGTQGYVGFSGATGGATATQTISGFNFTTFSGGAAVNILPTATPVSIAAGATLDLNTVLSQTIASLSDYGGSGGLVTNTASSATATLILGAPSGATTFSGNIGDNGAANAITLIKNGGYTQTLSGANTYTGGTRINAGVLSVSQIADAGPSGIANSGLLTFGGGTLQFTGASASTSRSIVNAGAANIEVSNSAGILTLLGNISGPGGLTKSGPGTLTISSSDTYTGGTAVNGGRLVLGDNNALGAATGGLTVRSGGTLDLAGYSPTVGNVSDGVNAAGGFTPTTATIVNTGGAATLTVNGNINGEFAGVITGPIAITKNGGSWMILSGNNAYTGVTTINGLLEAWSANALGSTLAGTEVNSGGTLAFKARTDNIAYAAEPLTLNGTAQMVLNTGAALRTTTWQGLVTLGSGASATVSRGGGANAGTLTFSNLITGNGSLTVSGTDFTVRMLADNSYTGATVINGATLELGNGGPTGSIASPTISNNGNFVINRSADLTIAAPISGTGNVVQKGPSTTTLTGNNSYTGATTINAGELRLASAGDINSSGTITINGGTLRQDSSTTLFRTTGQTLTFSAAGGTISGTGAIDVSGAGGLTVGNNAVLSPGDSPGAQHYSGMMTWLDGGTYLWEINDWDIPGGATASNNWDFIDLSGQLDLSGLSNGGFTIEISSLTLSNSAGLPDYYIRGSDRRFPILNSPVVGITGFSPSLFTINTSGFAGESASYVSWKVESDGNTLWLQYTAMIPEPTVVALFGLGSLLLLLGRRITNSRRPRS